MQEDSPPRVKLLEGLCLAVEETGYAAATIADIVRHAKVSKRTFYEEFADKEACFLAAYMAVGEELLKTMAGAVDPTAPWETQLEAAVRAYLSRLEERPALTRTFFLEIHAAGARALELRRQVMERFAQVTRELIEAGRRRQPQLAELSPTMAMALVGAVNELVLVHVEKQAPAPLTEVAETTMELVQALLDRKKPKRQLR